MSKTKSTYGRLNILRDKINEAVSYFILGREEECDFKEIRHISGIRYRIDYVINGEDNKIDFHYNNDGTTTIDPNPGKRDEFKIELADFLKESPICTHSNISKFEKPYFVFKDISFDDITTVIELVLEGKGIKLNHKDENARWTKWFLDGDFNETVVVSYFHKSQKLMVQGKPLKLFAEVYTLVMALLEVEEMPKVMEQNFSVGEKITKDEIKESLENFLPNSHGKLDEKMKKVLYQSIYNLRLQADMFDYTFLTFPSLRVLEGHLRYRMKEKNIPLEEGKFSMFCKSHNGKYVLQSAYQAYFTDQQRESVQDSYNFLNKNRNSLFHWNNLEGPLNIDRTKVIDNISDARGIILNVFDIIDNYYKE
ncbi:type II toxin-antitoxin system RnlA family toxin [Evansella clarkii]|uniref:type II toxin-antitoxin system RnlA family toxin n=1 Tax=Evansella clarkii TaxID=79879 RepID=UPI00147314FF|nr:type II toxin-antitoxin system RnlA family toxin [Evansella clarkii]